MSIYMQELCAALSRVLDHCAQLDRRRLAGYARNIDFRVSEIRHRLDLVDGYLERRRMMVAGTDQVYEDDIKRPTEPVSDPITPNVIDTSTNWHELEAEASELRKQIWKSARRFVMKCLETNLISQDKLFQIEDELDVTLRSHKPPSDL